MPKRSRAAGWQCRCFSLKLCGSLDGSNRTIAVARLAHVRSRLLEFRPGVDATNGFQPTVALSGKPLRPKGRTTACSHQRREGSPPMASPRTRAAGARPPRSRRSTTLRSGSGSTPITHNKGCIKPEMLQLGHRTPNDRRARSPNRLVHTALDVRRGGAEIRCRQPIPGMCAPRHGSARRSAKPVACGRRRLPTARWAGLTRPTALPAYCYPGPPIEVRVQPDNVVRVVADPDPPGALCG
jgi:hypothetical protein